METIQWLILAEGMMSGLFSIPWMYLASTLTIRFRTLTRKILYMRSTQKTLYSSNLGWEKRHSIIEGNRAKACIKALAGIVRVSLAKVEAYCNY